jgi:glycosyltransferase involved in cell wall biosynthesis
LRESIRHEESGLLVPSQDAPAFAAAIAALVDDPARRFALAAAARERALERDSALEDAELLDRYSQLANPREGAPACAA